MTPNPAAPNPAALKRLDLTKSTFMANGREYRIENGFSIERYCEYQVLEKELAYGLSFKGMYDKLVGIYGYFNKGDFAHALIAVNDLIHGVEQVEQREPQMLKLCALFINTPDEDRTTINADMIGEKIEDWKAEGYDVRDFFTLALNTMDGFIEVYKKLTLTTSQMDTQSPSE